MNNRSITDVPSDINDIDALTPNHFLLGRAHINVPPGHFENKRVTYSRRWKYAHQIADHVRKRLIMEYLPTHLPRKKWHNRISPLKFGQTVWILIDLHAYTTTTTPSKMKKKRNQKSLHNEQEHNPARGYYNKQQSSKESLCLSTSTLHFQLLLNFLNAADTPTPTRT